VSAPFTACAFLPPLPPPPFPKAFSLLAEKRPFSSWKHDFPLLRVFFSPQVEGSRNSRHLFPPVTIPLSSSPLSAKPFHPLGMDELLTRRTAFFPPLLKMSERVGLSFFLPWTNACRRITIPFLLSRVIRDDSPADKVANFPQDRTTYQELSSIFLVFFERSTASWGGCCPIPYVPFPSKWLNSSRVALSPPSQPRDHFFFFFFFFFRVGKGIQPRRGRRLSSSPPC